MTIPAWSRSRTTCDEHRRPAAAGRHGQASRVLVERDLALALGLQHRHRPRDRGPVANDDLDPLAADLRLELVRGPAGDDLAVVDDGDRVGQFVGFFEVLRREEQRRAFAHEAADDVPHPEPAAWVQPRRRLIHEQDPRPPDEGASEVEPAAHATRVRLDHAVAGVGEVELLEELGGPSPWPRSTAAGRAGRTSTGSRARSGSRRRRRTGRRGR